MEKAAYSTKFLQQRKFYTILPLLALPFLTFLYWSLVVKNLKKKDVSQSGPSGLITSLPDAFLKDDKVMDKFSYYQKAAEDSANRIKEIKKDPYRQGEILEGDPALGNSALRGLDGPLGNQKKLTPVYYKGKKYTDPNQVRVFSKLNELDKILAQSSQPEFKEEPSPSSVTKDLESEKIQKLDSLMASLTNPSSPDSSDDPEMQEINTMLEKILDIQHPERIADKLQKQSDSNRGQVFSVTSMPVQVPVTTLDNTSNINPDSAIVAGISFQQNGFFSLDEDVTVANQNAVRAEVDQDQTVVMGSTVKLRLMDDIYVAGERLAKGSYVFGTASINNERLQVEIESIRKDNSLFPVKLNVFDLDGMEGIYVPGAITRDVAKQSVSQDIQGLSLGSLDPSLGAQAASASIQAAKMLLGRKARLVQFTLKAGYEVLLLDGNAKSI